MDFRDRTAVVTGAASGIGRAICLRLAREGARLALIDRDEAGLANLREEIERAGARAASATADVGDRDALSAAVTQLTSQLGPADVLVPCAGVCGFELVDDLKVPQVERILQINFLGVVYAVEAVLPSMLQRRSGSIIGLASMTAVRGIPFEASYGASKAALVAYLESLRPSLRRRGVYVTLAYPGFVGTPLLDGLMNKGLTKPPGVMSADLAAHKILAAARRGYRTVTFPTSLGILVSIGRILPTAMYDWIMTQMAATVKLPY